MEANDLLSDLSNSENFKIFLSEGFNAKNHATAVIQGYSIAEELSKLAEGINLVDKELHRQVVARHEDLLSQATGIETLEGVLEMMTTRIQSLLSAIERIRNKVSEPYMKIVSQTKQLSRMQEACDLLRRIIRVMYVSKRLHTQLQGGAREITKAAQSLNELDYLNDGVDLSGIEIIESDRKFVKQARKDVEVHAKKMLHQGMETQNQSQVATALQVFHNLCSLDKTINETVQSCSESLHESLKNILDVSAIYQTQGNFQSKAGPGKAAMPSPGNKATFRATLWNNMEKVMDIMYSSCAQVHHLEKVLMKKRDPVTHVSFIEELSKNNDGSQIMFKFWKNVTGILEAQLQIAADSNSFIKHAFEGEYPKLLRLYNDLWKRLLLFKSNMNTGNDSFSGPDSDLDVNNTSDDIFCSTHDIDYDPEVILRKTLSLFENAYLSKSLSRLFDPVNLIFSAASITVPNSEDIETITKGISSELSVASVDDILSNAVSKNVAKTIRLFTVKSEQLLSTDGEASQVINAPTLGQQRNVSIVNALYTLQLAIHKIVDSSQLPSEAKLLVQDALMDVNSLMNVAIDPLLCSIENAMESIILTMHDEDFSNPAASENFNSEGQCSLYMRELQQFIQRAQDSYLAPFQCQDFVTKCIMPVASNCIDIFVRHASLVRPIGDGGKMRLAADFAQMELAISPLCKRISDLGKSYRILRAMRPLLFQSSDNIANSSAVGEIIPHSIALQFLFSRAPSELKSPHQAAQWSLSRFSRWLDDHNSEKDRLNFIKGGLESYVQLVTVNSIKEFAPVYPIMVELLQKGLQQHG